MSKMRVLFLSIVSFVFILSSCTKEGPEGPQGGNGPQGPAGAPGATGATGTANVIYTSWFATSTLTWADSTHADFGTISRANRAAPGVTAAVVDNGVVLAYYRSTASGVTQLPYTLGTTANLSQYRNILRTGTITFFVANLTTGTATGVVPTGDFRYVIIPGGVAGGRLMSGAAMGYSLDQLQWMSYEQVCKLFSIPADGASN